MFTGFGGILKILFDKKNQASRINLESEYFCFASIDRNCMNKKYDIVFGFPVDFCHSILLKKNEDSTESFIDSGENK